MLDFPPGFPGIKALLGSTPGNSILSIPVQPYGTPSFSIA